MVGDTLQFNCPRCNQQIRVRRAAQGRTVSCPGCQSKLRIPSPTSSSTKAPAADPDITQSTLDVESRSVDEPIPPTATTETQSSFGLESYDMGSFDFDGSLDPAADQPVDDFFGIDVPPVEVPTYVPVKKTSALKPATDATDIVRESTAEASLPPHAAPRKSSPARKVTDEKRRGKPKSKQSTAASDSPAAKVDLAKVIEQQLKGTIPKHRVDAGYRFALTATAVFMLLLPLAYTMLIAACGYGIYYYCTEVVPSLMSTIPRGRGAIIAIALYTGPVMIGSAVILFMIKPLFVTMVMPEGTRKRSLSREGEPMLFELVDRICDVTGAPKPSRIDVDADVNASASYGSGLKSLFSNDLILTIGVPLVAGLNTRQFVGVLAHEFGHFSQSASMRASYIIRAINHWFARIVYQRDGIDEWLDDVIDESEARIGLIMLIIQLFIQITRGILWLFMMIAHLSSCFLLRQMEYDADRYEVYVAGSKSFGTTSQALRLLAFAHHASMLGLGNLLEKAVMVDNLPRMTEALRNHTSADQQLKLVKKIDEEGTGPFDTHPCDKARIAAAEKINAQGMFQVQRPAREIFQHFDALCRNVTQDFYRNEIGRMIDPSELEPVEKHISVLA